MTYRGIDFDAQAIADLCPRHHIVKLSLFSSILHDDFGPDSDIDVLVEFAGPSPSLLDLGGIQTELTTLLGPPVDLKTWGFLSERLYAQIDRERRVQYAA